MKHFVVKAAQDDGIDLVVVANVPIMETGTFNLFGGGEQIFTDEDLEAAANAPKIDKAIKQPRQGVGHESELGDGEPAFGTYQDLRVKASGRGTQILYGDLHGVPRWLAKILPSAFPNRSIEGERNHVSASGVTHKLVVESVKLLGVILPGISTLSDLRHMYGKDAPEGTTLLASYMDPENKVIVANPDDDKIEQEGTVRQVDPKALREQLGLAETATDAEVDSHLAGLKALKVEADAAKAKADEEKAKADAKAEEDRKAAEAAQLALANLPSGTVLVDEAQFNELKIAAGRANELYAANETLERDQEIGTALKAGKFGKARVEHFQALWKADKEGCKALMASLAPGMVPVEEIGTSKDGEGTEIDADIYPESLLPVGQRAIVAAARAGKSHLELVPGQMYTDKVG